MTMAIRKSIKPAYAPFINLLEYLNAFVLLSIVLFNALLAKINVKPIKNVAEIFRAKYTIMFVLIMLAMNGFNSTAPKYNTPMTVVKQSMKPNRIKKKLGNTSDFNA